MVATRALRRRYARTRRRASAFNWQRVEDGYELHEGEVVYRVQKRTDLSDRQKWDLDQHLGLKPRDGKRREPWVVLIDGTPLEHAYGKKEAVIGVEESVASLRVEHAARAQRAASGSSIGLSIGLAQQQVPPRLPSHDVAGLGREDMRVLAEHLPELSKRPQR
jgi:hypothetical protein